MPVLEVLTLDYFQFTIMELEAIHSNLPSIKTLIIYYAEINAGKMPLSVSPATAITKIELSIPNIDSLQLHIQMYQYMAIKYPNLTAFHLCDKTLEDSNYQSQYLKQLFKDGVLPFLRVVGSQLDYYNFGHLPIGINVFKQLDDFGCRFKSLGVKLTDSTLPAFENLAQSEQSRYVNNLTIDGWATGATRLLKDMISLKILKISTVKADSIYEREIDLCDVLEACQTTLSDLTISKVAPVPNLPIPAFTTSIKYLYIQGVALTKTFVYTISNCFPYLEILRINCDIYSNLTISLSKIHLKEIEINLTSYSHRSGFLIKSTENDTCQHYAALQKNTRNSLKVAPIASEDYNEHITMTLIFASTKRLTLKTRHYMYRSDDRMYPDPYYV